MANQLSVTKSSSIKQLHDKGWSQRRIAEAVGVDRKTVRRHLGLGEVEDRPPPDSKGTIAPTDSDLAPAADPVAPTGSQCEPFRQAIEGMLSGSFKTCKSSALTTAATTVSDGSSKRSERRGQKRSDGSKSIPAWRRKSTSAVAHQ